MLGVLHPYKFDDDKIASTLRFLTQTQAYQDIHQLEAFNGAIYLYSDRYMSVGKPKGSVNGLRWNNMRTLVRTPGMRGSQ
ncbi:MAG: hypothetical protein ACSLEN_03275 [Candidatus Malihini olakiniferum]